MSSEVKLPKWHPLLDPTGRPWRVDSAWACGMPLGAFRWIKCRKTGKAENLYIRWHVNERGAISVARSTKFSIQTDHKPQKNAEQANYRSKSEVAIINGLPTPSGRAPYALLPFRALEVGCVPAAIQHRWEASLAASRATIWRQWFEALDENQQKAHVQRLSKITKDTFWAELWLEYEERSKPGHPRLVAAGVRAVALFDRELTRIQMRDPRKIHNTIRNQRLKRFGLASEKSGSLPVAQPGPSSAPLTPHNIKSLKLRLAPCYFRLPANAFRFATRIFSGKSYEEAVKEQKSNFDSWVKEGKVCRVIVGPDLVVGDDVVVPEDQVWNVDSQEEEAEERNRGSQGTRPSDED